MAKEDVSLLEEEMVQLSIKSCQLVPSDIPTLVCSVWTRKSYNPDNFRAQMRSIWKTRKKFDIKLAGKNLFFIEFEDEMDLESIFEGRPWVFCKQVIFWDID